MHILKVTTNFTFYVEKEWNVIHLSFLTSAFTSVIYVVTLCGTERKTSGFQVKSWQSSGTSNVVQSLTSWCKLDNYKNKPIHHTILIKTCNTSSCIGTLPPSNWCYSLLAKGSVLTCSMSYQQKNRLDNNVWKLKETEFQKQGEVSWQTRRHVGRSDFNV